MINLIDERERKAPVIVLIAPPYVGKYIGTRYQNLGISYLASVLRGEGFQVRLVDGFLRDLSIKQTLQEILEVEDPLLIGFSLLQYHQYLAVKELLPELVVQRPMAHITLGNYFPSFWYRELLLEQPSVDSIVRFEGENVLMELVHCLVRGQNWKAVPGIACRDDAGSVILNPSTIPQSNLDEIPHPARDDIQSVIRSGWPVTVHGGRGCSYGACTFCTVPGLYDQKFRVLSPEKLFDEVAYLIRGQGAKFILFTDDNFLNGGRQGYQRVRQFAKLIRQQGLDFKFGISCRANDVNQDLFKELKDAGLVSVFIGIESVVPRTLKLFRKGYTPQIAKRALNIMDSLGIKVSPGYIMFEADTTFEEIRTSVNFFRNVNVFGTFHLNQLTITLGTDLQKIYAAENKLSQHGYAFNYKYADPRVAHLVSVINKEYIPRTRVSIEPMYRLWFARLTWENELPASRTFDAVAHTLMEYDLNFLCETMSAIEKDQDLNRVLLKFETSFADLRQDVETIMVYHKDHPLHGR